MKKTVLFLTWLFLAAPVLPAPQETLSPAGNSAVGEGNDTRSAKKDAWIFERDNEARKEADRLIESVRSADKDTGDLPEANFQVTFQNNDLEKLIGRGENGLADIEYLLSDLKNGFFRQRIVNALKDINSKKALELLEFALKDRSSGVRSSAVRAIASISGASSVPKLNPLLYDRYAQRKDHYPVRYLAREAISFLNLKESIKQFEPAEKALKFTEAIRTGSANKEYFFCGLCAEELGKLQGIADTVHESYLSLKTATSSSTSLAAQNTADKAARESAAYFLLYALSGVRDERAKPEIDALFNAPGGYTQGMKLLWRADPAAAINRLLSGGLQMEEVLSGLKENTSRQLSPLKAEALADGDFREALMKHIMSSRSFDAYLDAATLYYEISFDRRKTMQYLLRYDPLGMERQYDPVYARLKALCLLCEGDEKSALEFDPFAPAVAFKEASALNLLEYTPKSQATFLLMKEYFRILDIKCCEEQVLAGLLAMEGVSEKEKELYANEQKKIREKQAAKIKALTAIEPPEAGEGVNLFLTVPENGFRIGEEVKIKLTIENKGASSALAVKAFGNKSGFDAGVFIEGVILNRLFSDEENELSDVEKVNKTVIIRSGESFEAEFAVLPANMNDKEGELEVIASYDGGMPVKGYEKGWIGRLLSEKAVIKISK